MAHDPGRRRFFGYFNLFVAAMLLLVLGNNYVMLYLGWEGVGLASYLLISFWYTRPHRVMAEKSRLPSQPLVCPQIGQSIGAASSCIGRSSFS